jgi:hypothetical protein
MTVYIVRRLHWEYQDHFFGLDDESPVKAFVSRRDAERYAEERDRDERVEWEKYGAVIAKQSRVGDQVLFERVCDQILFEVVEVELEPEP